MMTTMSAILAVMFTGALVLVLVLYRKLQEAQRRLSSTEQIVGQKLEELSNRIPNTMVYQVAFAPDGQRYFTYVSAGVEKLHGITAQEVQRDPTLLYRQIIPEDAEKLMRAENEALEAMSIFRCEARWIHPDGTTHWSLMTSAPRRRADGTVVWDGIDVDITEAKELQRKLLLAQEQGAQSRKMEAIGQLAGGIAHDFNNSLTGIIGAAEMLRLEVTDAPEKREMVDLILLAAERAGELTRRLLAFSRKGPKTSTVIDVAGVITDASAILRRTIDRRVRISVENSAAHTLVVGDDALLQNAFMNLGINAGHAMPEGGTLIFIVQNIVVDESFCRETRLPIEPGIFVDIRVKDSGSGMPPHVLEKLFEPFFTTKERGRGTGLGLSDVYGTVQEHRGAITVTSEEGKGTEFRMLLPASPGAAVSAFHRSEPVLDGTGTILIIDDDEAIRLTARSMLEANGYQVLAADNGATGLALFSENSHRIDMVFLDMVMPVMGGREALQKLRALSPDIPVLIVSGFSEGNDLAVSTQEKAVAFLHKPFRRWELLTAVAEALGGGKTGKK